MITKQDIIDYVMHTVWNPNPAVLKSLLDQLEASESPFSDEDFMEVTITCNYEVAEGSTIYDLVYCGKSGDEFGIFEVNNKSLTSEAGYSSTKINVYCPPGKLQVIGLKTEVLNQMTINDGDYVELFDASEEPQGIYYLRESNSLSISIDVVTRDINA